ncbi:MAG: DNA internalization-related competence protein ComEC/Rec2 [Anaerovoracaceae bacterium]|nr:DNA internalization-related competence protein ComEC/Rec2 [Anaerovoracaceae bacterium]
MRRPAVLIAFIVAAAILVTDSITGYTSDYLEGLEGNNAAVTGRVVSIVKKDDEYFKLQLSDVSIISDNGARSYKKKILVNVYSDIADYRTVLWDRVYITGEVSIPKERSNPGTFDYRRYLKSIGIRCIITAENIENVKKAGGIAALLKSAKCRTADIFESALGDDSAVVMGLLFGETSGIDEDIIETFRRGGTAHVLAVSGLHLGLLYSFLCRFKRKKRSIPADIAIVLALSAYTALAGFTASVVRACLMIFIHIAGNHLNRRYDLISSTCVSMIIILAVNPMQVYSAGFQMSFLAVITLGIMIPLIQKKIKGILLPMIAVQTGMVPYTMYVFNYVSLTSVISNIPVYFIAAAMIPAGISVIAFCWLPVIAKPAAMITGLFVKLLLWCNDFTYMGGVFTFDVASPSVIFLAVYYIFIFYMCSEAGQIALIRRNYKKIAAVFAAAVICGAGCSVYLSDGFEKTDMVFVDVGQGDCLHIKAGGKNLLIDGGGSFNYNVGKSTLKPYLLKNGVTKIDMAIATHLHTDHYQGLKELSQTYRIKKLGVYEANSVNENHLKKEFKTDEILYLAAGDVINMSRNVSVEVLSPDRGNPLDEKDENKNSLVLRVNVKGSSVLMTGDIDEKGEKTLIADTDIKADILKIAHHGSRYSSCEKFIAVAAPKIAVIQVGKNTYGHPSEEVIKRLEEHKITVLRNDEQGAVGIRVNKAGDFGIVTMRN